MITSRNSKIVLKHFYFDKQKDLLKKRFFYVFGALKKNFFKNNTKFVDIISKLCYINNVIDGTIAKW